MKPFMRVLVAGVVMLLFAAGSAAQKQSTSLDLQELLEGVQEGRSADRAAEALARAADFDDTRRYAGQWLAYVNDEQQRASVLAADS